MKAFDLLEVMMGVVIVSAVFQSLYGMELFPKTKESLNWQIQTISQGLSSFTKPQLGIWDVLGGVAYTLIGFFSFILTLPFTVAVFVSELLTIVQIPVISFFAQPIGGFAGALVVLYYAKVILAWIRPGALQTGDSV